MHEQAGRPARSWRKTARSLTDPLVNLSHHGGGRMTSPARGNLGRGGFLQDKEQRSMLFANNDDGDRVRATPSSRAWCPTCAAQMISKCGKIVVWHWAHESVSDCDKWSEGETPWHAAWKSRFADTERPIKKIYPGGLEVVHRADAVTPGGRVIEFQHSSLSADEVLERERFYQNMVWVIDGTKAFRSSRVRLKHERSESGSAYCKFVWLHRKRSFDEAKCPTFLDIGFAFRDIGPRFRKQSSWWDDGDDGLRDGLRRQPGIWQRVEIAPLLLRLHKRTEAAGWGQAVTHEEFCRNYGGACGVGMESKKSLRLIWGISGEYPHFDWSYVNPQSQWVSFSDICEDRAAYGADYEWCQKELESEVLA